MSQPPDLPSTGRAAKPRWKRRFRNVSIALAILSSIILLAAFWTTRDHIRTLQSLRKIEGTNIYVMDYYANYDMDEIRREGMNVDDIEGSCIDALFPDWIAPIARRLKSAYVPDRIKTTKPSTSHHCSSIASQSSDGRVLFGRNFDAPNDAILVLRIHKGNAVDSVSVIDLKYLNLNRDDLMETNLLGRIPLLFAPYYVMDGMNRHGLAVSAMTVPEAKAPQIEGAPPVIQASMMRLVLDYCQSVEEALGMLRKYNISFAVSPEHLMLADSSGQMVVVEFIEEEIRITKPKSGWLLCTNHLLWSKSEMENSACCERFQTGKKAMKMAGRTIDLDSFTNAVRSMSVDNWTMWTSIYDLERLTAKIMYQSKPELNFTERSMRSPDPGK